MSDTAIDGTTEADGVAPEAGAPRSGAQRTLDFQERLRAKLEGMDLGPKEVWRFRFDHVAYAAIFVGIAKKQDLALERPQKTRGIVIDACGHRAQLEMLAKQGWQPVRQVLEADLLQFIAEAVVPTIDIEFAADAYDQLPETTRDSSSVNKEVRDE